MSSATYHVSGMTCEHCVRAVRDELESIPGVTQVTVDLVSGGTSPVRVTSASPLADDDVADAIAEAGYTLAPANSLL